MEISDVLDGVQKRFGELGVGFGERVVDDLAGNLVILRQLAVELLGVSLYRAVAVLLDVVDYLGNDRRYLFIRLAAALFNLLEEFLFCGAVSDYLAYYIHFSYSLM